MKIGTKNIVSKHFGSLEVIKEVFNGSVIYEATPTPSVDPILANNSWETIKAVVQAGKAGNYWSLGDTKNIAVSGVGDVPHALVDMTVGRYAYASDSTKRTNAVFQAVPTIGNYTFNSSSNKNANNAYNSWYTSTLRTSMNSGVIYGLYDSSFTSLLEEVQTYEALDGTTAGNVVQYQADKLFLPAAREVKANYSLSQSCESGITQYGYYAQNSDANSQRKKYPFGSSSTTYWWLRSAYAGAVLDELSVGYYGTLSSVNGTTYSYGVAPCFAF